MTCMLAPLAEEFFFRGFLLRVLHERTNAVIAVLVTGIAFGLVHLPSGDWIGAIVLSLFGMALCVLFILTSSLVPCIMLHAFHNSISFGFTKELPWWGFLLLILGSVMTTFVIARFAMRARPAWSRVVAALLLPASALAQDPIPTPTPTPVPTPVPVQGALKLQAQKVHRDGERQVALTRTAWRVRGVLTPYVAGQQVVVRFFRDGRKIHEQVEQLQPIRGGTAGEFRTPFRSKRDGPGRRARPSTSPRPRWTRCAARGSVST